MTLTAELFVDSKSILGEGPIWDNQKQVLFWVNIQANEVLITDPAGGETRTIDVGQMVGTVVPHTENSVMLALQEGFAQLDLDSEALTFIHDPEADIDTNRFNDGKCDPAGRFWAGTMGFSGPSGAHGSLYRMDSDYSVHKILEDVTTSNGIVWSHDKTTMYYIDTPLGRVDAFDYDDASGDICNRRTAITIPDGQGFPDGMTIDADGNLWVAHWGGHRISCWDPVRAELVETIRVPAPQVTACAFGGPNLDQLYITTARNGLDDATLAEYPHAGSLFVVTPGARGVPAFAFNGERRTG